MNPLPAVGALLFALAFWSVAAALGYRVLRLLGVPFAVFNIFEAGFLSLTFGAASLQYLPYVLGLIGRLKPTYVRASLVVLLILAAPDLLRAVRALRGRGLGFRLPRLSAPAVLWGALFLSLMSLLLIRGMAVGAMSEDDGYHLSAPKQWLASGSLAYLPSYTNTNAAMGFEMLYVSALASTGAIGAKLLNYDAGLFALLGIVLAAARIAGVSAGLLAVSLLLIATPFCNLPFLFTHAYVDFAASWMAMASVLLWLAWRESRDRRLLRCLALCAGFAGSFKITALSLAIAWAVLLFTVESDRKTSSWRERLREPITLALLSAVPVIPWFCRNWINTGNPFFPMLSGGIPTRDWTPEHAALFARYTRYYAWGIASGARLDEMHRKWLLLATGTAVIAFTALAVFCIKQPILRRLTILAALVLLPCIASTGLVFRYWLPAVMILHLVAVALWTQREQLRRRTLWTAAGVLLIALFIQLPSEARTLVKNMKIVGGASTFGQEYPDDPMWRLSSYINANTPSDSRVLFASLYLTFGASSFCGLWVDRPCYTTDSHLQRFIRLDDWNTFLGTVEHAGISEVVIADKPYLAGRHGFSFLTGQNEYPFCRRLVDEYGEKQVQIGSMQLYRIHFAGKR